MIRGGLVSITFRQLSPEAIIELVSQAGLSGIEWGGDIHVPHGDITRARQVAGWTADAGLAVAAYGSYYRVGHGEPAPFEQVLDTAVALGAPVVRVWAGKMGSAGADPDYRARVVEDSVRIASLAQLAGLVVAYEFHGGTLTDTNESACRLLQEVDHSAMRTYWQPMRDDALPRDADNGYRLAGLQAVLAWLVHVHVFCWLGSQRLPLIEGQSAWRERLALMRQTGQDHDALIEFVQNDAPEAFLDDAAALKSWLSEA